MREIYAGPYTVTNIVGANAFICDQSKKIIEIHRNRLVKA